MIPQSYSLDGSDPFGAYMKGKELCRAIGRH
jgi:hypothetical protein